MSSLPSNEFLGPVFEKGDLIEVLRSYGLLHCPTIFHKIFHKKRIPEMNL